MLLDIEEIKNEIATALYNQCGNTKWENGDPEYKSFSTFMAERIVLITKLATIYSEYLSMKKNDKPVCEVHGHFWVIPENVKLAISEQYVCRTCKKHRVKVRKEVLVFED